MKTERSIEFLKLLKDLFIESEFVPIDFQVEGHSVNIELILTKHGLRIKAPLGRGYWTTVMIENPLLRGRLMDFLIEEYRLMLVLLLDTKIVKVKVTATTFAGMRLELVIEDTLPMKLTEDIKNHKELTRWNPHEA